MTKLSRLIYIQYSFIKYYCCADWIVQAEDQDTEEYGTIVYSILNQNVT